MPLRRLILAVAAVLTACSYAGPPEPGLGDNLVTVRATWFSYLNGDDIRAACHDGAPPRYRLVYNVGDRSQRRGYDVGPVTDAGARLQEVVDSGVSFGTGRTSLWQIFSPSRATRWLAPHEVSELERLLEESGAFAPPPVGLRLASPNRYWIVSGCHEGAFFLTGYRFPSPRFDRLRFVDFVAARDSTGVPFPPPPGGLTDVSDRCPPARHNDPDGAACFVLEIGDDGLVGVGPIL